MSKKDVPGIGEYGGPAGGWGALQAVAKALRGEMSASRTTIMLQVNQPQGFDCPGCAWPDPREGSSFEFCENGAKAVSWEATNKRVTPEFFAKHTVSGTEDGRPWSCRVVANPLGYLSKGEQESFRPDLVIEL